MHGKAAIELRPACDDLGPREAFPLPKVEFTQPGVARHVKCARRSDRLRRFPRALEIARIRMAERLAAQREGNGRGLCAASRRKRHIALPLKTARGVPRRFAVSNEDDLHARTLECLRCRIDAQTVQMIHHAAFDQLPWVAAAKHGIAAVYDARFP